jgi:hypothetical protein
MTFGLGSGANIAHLVGISVAYVEGPNYEQDLAASCWDECISLRAFMELLWINKFSMRGFLFLALFTPSN